MQTLAQRLNMRCRDSANFSHRKVYPCPMQACSANPLAINPDKVPSPDPLAPMARLNRKQFNLS
jgi:hypothetical protein